MGVQRGSASLFSNAGTTAIEYGIILPVLLLFFLGIIDSGRLLWTYTTLSRAIDSAARCAALQSSACSTVAQIQNTAASQAWGLTVGPSSFSVSYPACGVAVSATYGFTFFTPGFNAITLSPSACYPQ